VKLTDGLGVGMLDLGEAFDQTSNAPE